MSLCREKTTVVVGSGGTPCSYLLAGTRDLSSSSQKAPSVQLLPASQLLGTRITLMWDTTDAPSCREQRMRNINKEMRQPVNTFYVSPILCLELMWKHKVCNHVTGRRHFIWRGTAAITQYWEEFSPPFTPQHSSHSILFSTVSKPKQLAWLGAHGQPVIKLFGHVIVNLAFRSKRSLPGEETYLILNRKHIS